MSNKHILGRLLANENIIIEHGNYNTASFNMETRTLKLPLWNDEKVYNLLLGHEVGHALYTDKKGWFNAFEQYPQIPHDILNVVEDIRIERLMLMRYPGLVKDFLVGYKSLLDKDLFGLKGDTVIAMNKYAFIDRMNIKAKLRNLLVVEFTPYEVEIFKKANRTETIKDVVTICLEILEYINKNNLKVKGVNSSASEASEASEGSSGVSEVSSEATSEKTEGSEDATSEDAQDEMKEATSSDAKSKVVFGENGKYSDGSQKEIDQSKSVTYRHFENGKKSLVEADERGNTHYVCKGISKEQMDKMLVPVDALLNARQRKANAKETAQFMNEIKGSVSVMIKEFELRKAAFQYKKASISKTGTLDVNRLHNYKFSDDLFLKSMKLGEFQDHGMVMLVDYSGSMRSTLKSVIRQVLVLATFCKKANIPFDIYGFSFNAVHANNVVLPSEMGFIKTTGIYVPHLLSSSFTKDQYNEAFGQLVRQCFVSHQRDHWYREDNFYEYLGDTPLNEALIVMHEVLRKFKAKYNNQKVAFVTLTDGLATTMRINYDYSEKQMFTKVKIKVQDKYHTQTYTFTDTLIQNLKDSKLCDTTISFFLTGTSDFGHAYNRFSNQAQKTVEYELAKKKFKSEGVVSFDKVRGYDRVNVIYQSNDFLNSDDEMEITSESTKAQITKQFKKHATSQKNNRVIAAKFTEIVA